MKNDIILWVKRAALIVLSLTVLVLAMLLVTRKPVVFSPEVPAPAEEDRYILDRRTVAEFQPVVLSEFTRRGELVVYSAEASQTTDLTRSGWFNLVATEMTQSLTYKCTGYYYIDLDSLGRGSISLDEKNGRVIIEVPHARLMPIEIDPDRFEAGDVSKGWLAIGDMTFTASQFGDLERQAKAGITAELEKQAHFDAADANAIETLTGIFEPLINAVDSSYHVEIQFISR